MIFSTLYFSELLNHTILDGSGREIGRLVDILVTISEGYPTVAALQAKGRKDQSYLINWNEIRAMDQRNIFCKPSLKLITNGTYENSIYLKRDLLDHQIVDINGRKVVRINDLKLAEMGEQAKVVAVDIGLSGLLRRLGVERFISAIMRLFNHYLKDELIFWDNVERIETEQTRIKLTVPYRKLSKLHPADLADILEELGNAERSSLLAGLDVGVVADVLQEVEPEVQAEIIENIGGERASDILEAMPADEAAEILGELEEDQAEEILRLMEAEEAAEVREILEYGEETAGRLMTTEFVCFDKNLTTEETINKLRSIRPDANSIFYLYIVDAEERLLGVVSLRDLVVSKPDTILESIMNPDIIYVKDTTPHHEVVELITKYDLLAVPVVNAGNELVGMVVINDVVDALMLPKWKRKFGKKG